MTRIISIVAIATMAAVAFGQSAGMKAIASAAEALGGKDKIVAVRTLVMEGSGVAPNIGQNPHPEGPLPTWWVPEFKRTIDLANGRARTEQHRIGMFPFALPTDQRQNQGLDGDVAFNINAEGRAQRAPDAAVTDRRIEMLATPVTIVRAALDPGAKVGAVRRKGREELIDIVTAKGDKLTLALDSVTHLPASVSWMTSSENLGDVVNTTSFEDYETVSGIQLPKRYVTKIDFREWTSGDFHVSKNTVDGDVGDLAAPAGVRSAAAPTSPAISVDAQQVAKGIWWLAGTGGNAFSILFEFDDHLTLFEAPTSEARTKAVIDKARAIVPNKPLTEVIVTHHHFDHTGGLRTAVAEGLTVISHQGNESIFKEMTSRKATLKPDLLTKSGKTLKFRAMDDTLVLKDGSMEVDLFRLHDNTHSPYLIAAFVPRDNLLVEGDLMDMTWVRHPWAENYRQNLAMRKIHFAKDIPVHGRIATFDEEMAALAEMEKRTIFQDQAMLQADRAFVEAVAGGDKAALENLLDANFSWTDWEGRTETRAEVLQNPPKPAIESENDAQLKQFTYGEIGDVQANLGRAHALRVWVKRAGVWKAIVYQEVMSLDAPPSFAPGAGKDCENPCKTIAYQPKNETEQQVVAAYSKLETAAMAHNSAVFATVAADEFVAASSNSDKLYDKRGRMEDFDHSKMAGVAPTPLMSARMFDFGDAVVMTSEHQPDRGKPLHVTRLWVRRDGSWVETLSYQTSVKAAAGKL